MIKIYETVKAKNENENMDDSNTVFQIINTKEELERNESLLKDEKYKKITVIHLYI